MFPVFESLKGIIKVPSVVTDNNVFRLHYRFTVVALVAFSLLVTSKQYFGDPIDCIQGDDIPEAVLETFCWIHATFTLPDALEKKVGEEVPYPGIDKYVKGEKRVYHKYYQWVCFVLFLQAILCYIPRYLWKLWEGGRVKNLVLGLNSPILPKKDKDANKALLVEYLTTHMTHHKMYIAYYVVCEILNFGNIIGQMYLLDTFLGGEFTTFGVEVLKFTEMEDENRIDPMIRIFPRMSKCTFHRYGPSGDVQKHDALCILPLNIINEKIYIFIWFWFVILAILSGLILVYRFFTAVSPRVRFMMLKSRARLSDRQVIESVMHYAGFGDWFIIYLLTKNLDPLHMRDVLKDLSKELEQEKPLLPRNDKEKDISEA